MTYRVASSGEASLSVSDENFVGELKQDSNRFGEMPKTFGNISGNRDGDEEHIDVVLLEGKYGDRA